MNAHDELISLIDMTRISPEELAKATGTRPRCIRRELRGFFSLSAPELLRCMKYLVWRYAEITRKDFSEEWLRTYLSRTFRYKTNLRNVHKSRTKVLDKPENGEIVQKTPESEF